MNQLCATLCTKNILFTLPCLPVQMNESMVEDLGVHFYLKMTIGVDFSFATQFIISVRSKREGKGKGTLSLSLRP